MTISYSNTLRTSRMDAITTALGNGALLRLYDGTKPSPGGTATTKLAELTGGSPFAPGASAGVLTASPITQDSSADATGTATWFRLVTSGGTYVMDGTVTATGGGGDLQLSTTSIVATQPVAVSGFVITEGNP